MSDLTPEPPPAIQDDVARIGADGSTPPVDLDPGTSVELSADRFVAGGDAMARAGDGRVIFAEGALPGEEVVVEITQVKRDWARGVVTRVVSASPARRTPPCPHRIAGCGGCDWQHLADDEQLPFKLTIVEESLRRTARLSEPLVTLGQSVSSFGYRTSARVVGDRDGRAGFRSEGSHEVVTAHNCLIVHPSLAAAINAIEIEPGVEAALRVSAATGAGTAIWELPVPTDGSSSGRNPKRRTGKQPGNRRINAQMRNSVRGLPPEFATGPRSTLIETVAGHNFRVSAPSFFQSGPAAAELLVAAVAEAAPELADASLVIDLYAGVGLFAAAVTGGSTRVVAVESSRSAIDDARVNLKRRTATIVRSEVGQWRPSTDEIGADVVIADPARSGLGRPGVATVVAIDAPVLVLVSCDPVSLARDAQLLSAAGYEHKGSQVFDLFPQTHHVEVVTRFVRAGR